MSPREHILFVHAHPDDEVITTGGTIVTLLDAGASVTLITCTRGERGEVVPAELQHLTGDALGAHRERELAAAVRSLGLRDHRFLGDAGACAHGVAPHRYRDSGMQWGPYGPEPLNEPPASEGESCDAQTPTLIEADFDALVLDVCAVISDVKPTAVISYDDAGGYGHPDHVRTHEAASTAAMVMKVPFYAIVPAGQERDGDTRVSVSEVMERKKQALNAHQTQLTVEGDTIVHAGGQQEQIRDVEVFRQLEEVSAAQLDWRQFGPWSKTVTCVLAFLMGSLAGLVGTANHQIAFASVSLAISAGLLVGLRLLFYTRTVATFAALGLLLVVGLMSTESPGGAVIIGGDGVGLAWSIGAAAIALFVLGFPSRTRPSRDTMKKLANVEKVVDAS